MSADIGVMWSRYVWPGLIGIGSSASGVVLFVAGAAAGVHAVWATGMILAMTGFFLGIGQVLKLPRAAWSYPILLACMAPVASFFVFVVPSVT